MGSICSSWIRFMSARVVNPGLLEERFSDGRMVLGSNLGCFWASSTLHIVGWASSPWKRISYPQCTCRCLPRNSLGVVHAAGTHLIALLSKLCCHQPNHSFSQTHSCHNHRCCSHNYHYHQCRYYYYLYFNNSIFQYIMLSLLVLLLLL